MSEFTARANWQARTLAGSFLRNKVAELVEGFDAVIVLWQHEGQEGGFPHDETYSPIGNLISDLEELKQIEELAFWCDTPEAHQQIDKFRRELQEAPSDE